MKPSDDIEKLVRQGKPRSTTSSRADKLTLDDSFSAMDRAMQTKSSKFSPGRKNFSTIAIRIAAAAAIVIAVGLFLGRDKDKREVPPTGDNGDTNRETKLISMMSLRLSYQRGGLDALDEQFRDTLDAFGPRSSGISMRDLLEGTNGS
ncbi:MAG: hypothetical protein JW715_15365 [Sedimentisphaerales bacterium]|nr:hypothetical protein [Sedimentisphaerales bacterium]